MIFEYKSKIGKGDKKGVSSRTIIPKGIIKILGVDFGDDIIWKADVSDKGVTVTVKPVKKEK
jgi:hypothetical protein